MRYVFGAYTLDTERYELHRAGARIPLRPKAFQLLAYLIRHRDRVVVKDELVAHLWPNQFVGDAALKSCIMTVRKAVGDAGRSQRIIQTLHSHGYRFVAAVTPEDQGPPSAARPALSGTSAPLAPSSETVPGLVTAGRHPPAPTLEQEHKQVTVLRCTLAHAPELATHLGPEAMHSLMHEVLAVAQRTMQRYEGTITQFMGDGFLALFGAPVAHEDHARRAVLAALELQQRLRTCPTEIALPQDTTLAACIGLHTGPIVVGSLANDPQQLYTAVGETTHVVTRLQPLAAPGTVVISEVTYRLVHDEVWAEAGASLEVAEPTARVAVYTVRGIIRQRSGVPGHHARDLSRFVGRARELAVLHERLAYATQGQGQVVGLVGEPGMGKSRLLYEFAQSLTGQAVTYHEGHGLAYGSATPYLPVRDLLRQHCGITGADGPEAITIKVRQAVQEAEIASEEGLVLLLQLLDVPIEAAHVAHLSSETQRTRTFALLRQLVLHASQRQPLVLAVENGHWLDATSEEWLTTLVERLSSAAILLLVTYRPGYRPPWLEQSLATQVALPRLVPQDSLAVVQSVAQRAPLPVHLAQAIVARAGGNPFFLEELTWAVLESGSRRVVPPIPETIQAVLAARIDRLPPAEKRLVQTAAVIGTDVSVPLLQAVTGMAEETLAGSLRHLQAAEFLYETRLLPELTYTFKHVLTREVAYASLPRTRRQTLHTMTGQALEALYAERFDEVVDRLAYHYAHSGMATQAVKFLGLCAAQAVRHHAHAEAAMNLQDALCHTAALPVADQERCHLELSLRLAFSCTLLGRFQETLDLLLPQQACLEHLNDPTLAGPYYFRLGMITTYLGQYVQATRYAQRAIAEAQRCHDTVTMGQAYYGLMMVAHFTGQLRQGVEYGRQAREILRHSGAQHQYWLGMVQFIVALLYGQLGELPAALTVATEVEALGEAMEDSRLQSFGAIATGWIKVLRGEEEAGIAACHRGLERATDPFNLALAQQFLGYAYLIHRDPARAIPAMEQAMAHAGRFRYRYGLERARAMLSDALCAHGHLAAARELAQQALAGSQEAGHYYSVGLAQRALGRIAQASGVLAEAERYYTDALATFVAMSARYESGCTHLDLATLADVQGNPAATATHLSTAYGLFEALQVPHYVERTAQLARAFGVALQ